MSKVDELVSGRGLDAPVAEERDEGPSPIEDPPTLGLRDEGISTILWATGFRSDYAWIEPEVTDEYGWPRQRRGVSAHPGLFFVGVNWLHKRRSALFCGVGEDAEHVVSELVAS
jgi:putative flavoprotein involved in K+ transport